jgi:hypothetical protein
VGCEIAKSVKRGRKKTSGSRLFRRRLMHDRLGIILGDFT